MHRIGIMQGRLSPLVDNKIQAFPSKTWREEFSYASKLGFDLIEWILDLAYAGENPILSSSGRNQIIYLQKKHKVDISIICCDYFMEFPLHSEKLEFRLPAIGMLIELMRVCPEIDINLIELPLLGKSEIRDERAVENLIKLLNYLVPIAEKQGIFILLETNLTPKEISSVLKLIPSNRILINYDTGNSAYWGFKPKEEISIYGNRIGNVHIKDCTQKNYSVPLGEGNVDFELVFKLLRDVGYRGDFILQTARANDHLKAAKTYYEFTKHYIKKYLT